MYFILPLLKRISHSCLQSCEVIILPLGAENLSFKLLTIIDVKYLKVVCIFAVVNHQSGSSQQKQQYLNGASFWFNRL